MNCLFLCSYLHLFVPLYRATMQEKGGLLFLFFFFFWHPAKGGLPAFLGLYVVGDVINDIIVGDSV